MSKSPRKTNLRTRDLQIPLPGTKLVLGVMMEKLAGSSAGTNGIKYNNICREHRLEVNRHYVCPQHPDEPLPEEKMMKRFKGGKRLLDLEPALIEERKVRADGIVKVVRIIAMERIGLGSTSEALTLITPGTYALYPADVEAETLNRYTAFHAYLCEQDGRPARVAQVRTILNKRTVHGFIRPLPGGGLVFEEKYRPEDCKRFREGFTWASFPASVRERISQEGAKAALGQNLDFESLNEDPYREAMMELFTLLAEGKPLPEPEPEPVEPSEAVLDLFASG